MFSHRERGAVNGGRPEGPAEQRIDTAGRLGMRRCYEMRDIQTDRLPQATASYVLTSADLRRIYGVCDGTLRLWRKRGLPYIGGNGIRPRYSITEVEDWLRNAGRRND